VIAPVPDVCPGIVRFGLFPIQARAGNAIGIVAICGRGVQKHADHVFNIFRVGTGQRFPVLENVTPIAFVIEPLGSIRVFDLDRKPIPRTAWIAMSAAEGEGQVRRGEADQVWLTAQVGKCL
jgi:hypothetical protein